MLPDEVKQVSRILAVRMDNIGDVVMLSPALRAVRGSFPESRITLLASPAGCQVAEMLPWVDDVIIWRALWQDASNALAFQPEREFKFIEQLKQEKFDLALIYTSFSQTPFPPAYACYLAGIPIRVGLAKDFGGGVLSHYGKPPMETDHQVDRDLAVNRLIGIPQDGTHLELRIPEQSQTQASQKLASINIVSGQPYIIIAPGASCVSKRYPVQRAAELCKLLAQKSNLPVLIIGSERDIPSIQPVLDAVDNDAIFSLVGQTGVSEMAALISNSLFVIANNSSAMHIADAFRKPMLVLFSGTDQRSQWAPRNSPAILLQRQVKCSPCYRFDCPYEMECLDFPPEEVAELIVGVLEKGRAVPVGP